MYKKQGFTLIELLVVVLIIGILSSVALPQYTKAVEKSRAAEALPMLKTLREQQALCFLSHGEVPECMQGNEGGDNLFSMADITLHGETNSDCVAPVCGPASKNFVYALDGQYIYANRRGDKYYLETTALSGSDCFNKICCYNMDDSTNWCKIIGFTKPEGDLYLQP